MSDEVKGWRAVPPAFAIAMVALAAYGVFRAVYLGTTEAFHWAPGVALGGQGIAFAGYALGAIGAFELARRTTGKLSLAAKIVAVAFAVGLAFELLSALIGFDMQLWQKQWLRYLFEYAHVAIWLAAAAGLAWVAIPTAPGPAIAGLALVALGSLPQVIEQPLLDAITSKLETLLAVASLFDVGRALGTLLLVILVARGETPTDRPAGAEGLRSAARAMWLRVIAALAVVGVTMMMAMTMSARDGGAQTFKLLRFVIMAGQIATMISFLMFGVGVARTARATIANLPRYPLALASAGSLWCAGVALAQMSWVYRALYKAGEYTSRFDRDYMTALSVTTPLVVIAMIALVAFAVGKLANERSTIALQSEAQGKGVGIVCMLLVQLAITQWMIPKATTDGSRLALMFFGGIAGLIAVMMIARLCASGADEISREPGLPMASIVPPG